MAPSRACGDPSVPKTPYAIAATTVLDQEIQGSEDRTFKTTTSYDTFGNATHTKRVSVGTADVLDERTAIYNNQVSNWTIGQLTDATDKSTVIGKSVSRHKRYFYNPWTGILISTDRQPGDPALYLSTTVIPNAEGQYTTQLVSGTGDTRKTTIDYDPIDGIEPVRVTNGLGHQARVQYHRGFGVPVRTEDANGVVTRFQYDRFGRLRAVLPADGNNTSVHYTKDGSPFTVHDSRADGANGIALHDRLGRIRENMTRSMSGAMSHVLTQYDKRFAKHPASVSRPFFELADAVFETFDYDNLGRIVTETHADASNVKHVYGLLSKSTRIDEMGRRKTTKLDAVGRLEEVLQYDDKGVANFATYDYAPFGQLHRVYDAKFHSLEYTYDAIGRLTKQADPNRGVETLKYNEFDELVESVDNAGDVTVLGRDSIGRVFTRTDKDGGTCFVWDAASNGLGKLASAVSPDAVVTAFGYDAFSRLTEINRVIDGRTYQVDVSFDPLGRIQDLTYPQVGTEPRLVVRSSYAPNGDPDAIAAPGGPEYWRAERRNAAGQLLSEIVASGLRTIRQFDAKRGFPTTIDTGTIATAGETGDVQALRFEAYADGNPKVRTDALLTPGSQKEIYVYDALGRLSAWSMPGQGSVAFAYDLLGNLTSRATTKGGTTDTLTFEHTLVDGAGNAVGPNAVTKATYGSFEYDKTGQRVGDPDGKIDYTSVGLPKKVTRSGADTTFLYDAFQTRVAKRGPGASTTYVGGIYERRVTAGLVEHVFQIGGVAQVTWKEDPLGAISERHTQYLHDDGRSVSVVTDDKKAVMQRLRYDAFGGRVNPSLPLSAAPPLTCGVNDGYTGQEHDDDLGLVNMQGRIYDAKAMRFITPDSFMTAATHVHALDRYAYVLNNPLRFSDPSGFTAVDDLREVAGSFGDFVQNGGEFREYDPVTDTNVIYVTDGTGTSGGYGSNHEVDDLLTTLGKMGYASPNELQVDGMRIANGYERDRDERRGAGAFTGLYRAGYNALIEAFAAFQYGGEYDYDEDANRIARPPSILKETLAPPTDHEQADFYAEWKWRFDLLFTFGVPGEGERGVLFAETKKPPRIKVGSANGPTAGHHFSPSLRTEAFAENPSGTCVFCREKGTATQVDHVIPRARGGNATLDNAQLACPHCNQSKGAHDFPKTPPAGYEGRWPPRWGKPR